MAEAMVSDELWVLVSPLIPSKPRRRRYPGRRPLDDRAVLDGILFVLTTGIGWERLPKELGWGSGTTCWRRLRDRNDAGVWPRLHAVLLAKRREAGRIDRSRAVADFSHVRAVGRAPRRGRARSTRDVSARSTTS